MIHSILFDFDGTLANTAPGIVATYTESFRRMRRPIPTPEEITATIGLPLPRAYQALCGMNEEEAQEATQLYLSLFMEYELPHITLFPGTIETLERLASQGRRRAIVTSRDRNSLNIVLQHNHAEHLFEAFITHDDGFPSKPAPDMVLALLQRMHIEAEQTLVVGDTTFDILMGNRAGCHTCAVTYGNHSQTQLLTAHPDHIITSLTELTNL